MIDRKAVRIGALVWAGTGLVAGVVSLPAVNRDALPLVAVACVLGSGSAALAGYSVTRGFVRRAGVWLVLSVITPTFFAWILNIPALVAGFLLIAAPTAVGTRQQAGGTRA